MITFSSIKSKLNGKITLREANYYILIIECQNNLNASKLSDFIKIKEIINYSINLN